MKKLPYSEERIRQVLNDITYNGDKMTDGQISARLEACARAMGINTRVRAHNADQQHRTRVAQVRASGDSAALRKLANENLAKRRK